jgi:hypothetical protein
MNRIDQDALTRALVACRAQGAGRARQLDAKLADEHGKGSPRSRPIPRRTGRLVCSPGSRRPAMPASRIRTNPSEIRAPSAKSAELLRRLLDAGLSRFEPDPLRAITEAEKRRTVTWKLPEFAPCPSRSVTMSWLL